MALPKTTQYALAALFAGAVAVMVVSDPGEGVLEYVYVDKVVDALDDFRGREFKMHGKVVEGTIQRRADAAGEYRFTVEYNGRSIPVEYHGIVPDTFQEGGEVVLTGRLEGGRFDSSEMSAKCPSKYEAGSVEPKLGDAEQGAAPPAAAPSKRPAS